MLLAAAFFCLLHFPTNTVHANAIHYLGDVDLDGNITAGDARLALRYVVDLEHLPDEALLYVDFDANGSVTASDARMILRVCVELEPLTEPKNNPVDREPHEPPAEEKHKQWLTAFSDAVNYDDLSSDMNWLVDGLGVRSWWDGTQNLAADQIYDRLINTGYTKKCLSIREFTRGGILGRNIMAVIPTIEKSPEILLVMAHYDTARETGGAVDNASGTAALLQLAKLFKNAGQDFGAELHFLFTAGEEQGYYGAYSYVNALTQQEKQQHYFVFNIDMAGKPNDLYEPGRAYYLCVNKQPTSTDGYYAPAASKNTGSAAVDEAKAAFGNLGEDGYFSPVRAGVHDIVPFCKAGMEALTLSWRCISAARSNGADHDLATPYFTHTPADDMRYFDMPSLYQTTRLAAYAIGRLLLPFQR